MWTPKWIKFGDKTDSPDYLGVVPVALQADGTSRSGTIGTGGQAQVLMAANVDRRGWSIQNQSTQDLYLRSRGESGTVNATQDHNSIKIPPGAYYEPPVVDTRALSIIGPTTGQAFYAREW